MTATDGRLFQAPFRAGIMLKDYQLTPLMRALELPRANLFIADDVGLGKTIEAGLVMQELLLRQSALSTCSLSARRRCCFSGRAKWRAVSVNTLKSTIDSSSRGGDSSAVSPSIRGKLTIVSSSRTRPFVVLSIASPLLRMLGDKMRKSLLILDEAHTAAPASASVYAVDSKQTEAIRDIAPKFENRLFLSATPHNGHSNSFSALLEILDPQRFLRGTDITDPSQLRKVMVRRLKSDLIKLGRGDFPVRRVLQVELKFSGTDPQEPQPLLARYTTDGDEQTGTNIELGAAVPAEIALSQMLSEYSALMMQDKKRKPLILIRLQQRLLSCVEAFARTLKRHIENLDRHQTESSEEQQAGFAYDAADDDADGRSAEQTDDDDDDQAGLSVTSSPGDKAGALLEQMRVLAEKHRHQPDAKVRALLEWIRANQCAGAQFGGAKPGSAWTDKRLLIFTEFGHTKNYLRTLLQTAIDGSNGGEERIAVFDGGMGDENRRALQQAFNGPPAQYPLRILIATDAAREGVNLQGHCADLFHFDIPWNPARMEQRNGRIDRTLQLEPEVRCAYFYYSDRREDVILNSIVRKVATIESQLGSLGTVVSGQLEDALAQGIDTTTASKVEETIDLGRAAIQHGRQRTELEPVRDNEAALRKEIQRADEQLNASKKQLVFEPRLLRELNTVGLRWAQAGPLTPTTAPTDEPLLEAFLLPELNDSWQKTLDHLRPPKEKDETPGDWRRRPLLPVVLEPPRKLATPVVHLHLAHPFVERVLSRFLAQGFSAHDLARVTVLPNDQDALVQVLAFGRLTVFGRGAARLHDQIVCAAAKFDEAKKRLHVLSESSESKLIDRVEVLFANLARLPAPSAKAKGSAREWAEGHFSELWPHVQAEADALSHTVEQKLKRRGEAEASDLKKIIEGQIAFAKSKLNAQLEIQFKESERIQEQQYEADREYLKGRKETLANELEKEPQVVRENYEVLRTRLQPVGLVYLWPVSR